MSQIQFKGKQFTQNHHLGVKYHELIPKKDKSLTDPRQGGAGKVHLDDNLIIHGDNLKALKALLPTYAGKVKCIYIDPPYNTGNEHWAYNDNVNSPMMQDWLGKVVDREDLTRHDKWLCMMAPRLKLLRELLRDDGVIFISIDDNEQHRLRMLMDEIFGEENFVTNFIWKKKGTSTNVAGASVSELTDYVLAYGRTNIAKLISRIRAKETREYSLKDDEGSYRLTIIEKKNTGEYERESMRFPIMGVAPREGKRWQIGEEKARELEKKNRFIAEDGIVKLKIYDFEDRDTFSAQPNLLGDHGTTDTAAKMLTEIFGKQEIFNNPKPIELIEHLISISTDKDSIILDSFAGSGTTAHAVLALNKEDGLPAPRPNTFYVYAIKCDDASLYIGQTEDLGQRWQEHVSGTAADWTKRHKPLYIAHYEEYPTREQAVKREQDLKTGFGRKWLKREIEFGRARQAGGNRKFILVEMEDYTDSITAERVRRVIKGVKGSKDENLRKGLGGSFSYFELGKPKGKTRLIFAPTKYLDQDRLDELRIVFAQLPFEIYKLAE